MKLYLAPIKGITDTILRNALAKYWGGFEAAIAPFFLLPSTDIFDLKILEDVKIENQLHSVIPQIITKSPRQAKIITKHLIDMGHEEVNLNFSCPFPIVINKGRGSILMKNPELIREIIRTVKELPIDVSIKLRLGFDEYNQAQTLLDYLESEDIMRVFLHARLATQMYGGDVNLDAFKSIRARFPLIYNGDIRDKNDFMRIDKFLENQTEFMIGRGAIYNPAIFAQLRGKEYSETETSKIFREMIYELLANYREKNGDFALSQMKALWKYFCFGISDEQYIHQFFRVNEITEMEKMLHDLPDWKVPIKGK